MAFSLPPTAGAARNAAILDAIHRGNFSVPWSTVRSDTADGHHGEFRVFADALMIEGIRINVSAALQQQIADLLGCSLMTAKLMDLCWLQRSVTLKPIPASEIGVSLIHMDTTDAMERESNAISAALSAQGDPVGLISTVGKTWILDNGMLDTSGQPKLLNGAPMAVNFGWHLTGVFQGSTWEACPSVASDCRVIQGRGFRHDFSHTDYSQVCLLVSRTCFVDGASRDLLEVLQDPALAPLVSHQGPLKVLRQPGVPPQPTIVASTPCVGPGCPQLVSWMSSDLLPTSSEGKLAWVGAAILAFGLAGGLLWWSRLRHPMNPFA